ncbi:MAG: sulfotransferase [Chloroflexi bacterium]|nr:sulfotransferase [Chloroflexota bacterium]
MPMPNFLIIGAAKSGTTALYHYLKQHPQIYTSPVKEPRFFAFEEDIPRFYGPGDDRLVREFVTNFEDYLGLFEAVTDQIAIGEASNVYLTNSETSSRRIQHHLPNAKLIAVLRHPAERAYSNYLMLASTGKEYLGFTQALEEEEERKRKNWAFVWLYKNRGFYYALLRPYFDRFPREQIRIYLYDDWNTTPREVLQDIFRFLQVDDSFVADMNKRQNVSYIPRSHAIQVFLENPHPLKTILKPLLPQTLRRKIISKMQLLNQTKPPPLDPELRRQLTEEYRDDILKLQDLIGRDLTHWLKT